jgi:hypothetical protein
MAWEETAMNKRPTTVFTEVVTSGIPKRMNATRPTKAENMYQGL